MREPGPEAPATPLQACDPWKPCKTGNTCGFKLPDVGVICYMAIGYLYTLPTSEEGLDPLLPFNSLPRFHFDLFSLFRESGVPLVPSTDPSLASTECPHGLEGSFPKKRGMHGAGELSGAWFWEF